MLSSFTKIFSCLLALGLMTGAADAGSFRVVDYRGGKALWFSGDIEAGDALRFALIRHRVQPYAHGYPVLILDSPGGDVDEAVLIAELMRGHGFHTVVRDGTECGSACASVIFLAGALRTVEQGGVLGQHSCSIGGRADLNCNRTMAEYAMSRGVRYDAVAQSLAQVGPDEMRYFDRQQADDLGLTRYYGETELRGKTAPRVAGREAAQPGWMVDFIGDGFRAFTPAETGYGKPVEISLYCLRDAPGRVQVGVNLPGSLSSIKRSVTGITLAAGDVTETTDMPLMAARGSHVALEAGLPVDPAALLAEDGAEITIVAQTRAGDPPLEARIELAPGRENIAFAFAHCASRDMARN